MRRVIMDDIIIRVLSGKAEPIEELRLANWRAESSQNEQYFTEVAAIWDWAGAPLPANVSESLLPPPSLETIVSQGEALRRQDVRLRFARGIGWEEIRPWAAAAVIAAVSLGVWIGRLGPSADEVMGTEYFTGSTEAVTVALADGSFIRLGPGSRVRFVEHAGLRET
jgi:ferric-dicitrate binding protein FerR (iron transport regulator)